jgi:hypothetical protein
MKRLRNTPKLFDSLQPPPTPQEPRLILTEVKVEDLGASDVKVEQ